MFFYKLVENFETILKNQKENKSLYHSYVLYEHCLFYASMNSLFLKECGDLLHLFSEYLTPNLLNEGYVSSFMELYKKLKDVLLK